MDLERLRRLAATGDLRAAQALLAGAERGVDRGLRIAALDGLMRAAAERLGECVETPRGWPATTVRASALAVAPDAGLLAVAEGRIVHFLPLDPAAETPPPLRAATDVVRLAVSAPCPWTGNRLTGLVTRESTELWTGTERLEHVLPCTRIQAPEGFSRPALVATDGPDMVFRLTSSGRLTRARPALEGRLWSAHEVGGLVVQRELGEPSVVVESPDGTESRLELERPLRQWVFHRSGERALAVDTDARVHWFTRTLGADGLALWSTVASFWLDLAQPSIAWPAATRAGIAIGTDGALAWDVPGGPAETIGEGRDGRTSDCPHLGVELDHDRGRIALRDLVSGAAVYERDGASNGDGGRWRLSPHADRALWLNVDPSGRQTSVALRRLDGSWPRLLVADARQADAVFSPDGNAVAVAVDGSFGARLERYRLDGEALDARPLPGRPRAIGWSAGGIAVLTSGDAPELLSIVPERDTVVRCALAPMATEPVSAEIELGPPDGLAAIRGIAAFGAKSGARGARVVDLGAGRAVEGHPWTLPRLVGARHVLQIRGDRLELIEVVGGTARLCAVAPAGRGARVSVIDDGRACLVYARSTATQMRPRVFQIVDDTLVEHATLAPCRALATSPRHRWVITGREGGSVAIVDALDPSRALPEIPIVAPASLTWSPAGTEVVWRLYHTFASWSLGALSSGQ